MVQDVHLESLLARIEELRGRFGRASADLDAICSRARSSDFRGVLQNARVVVETLLRSIIHREKGQAPGKDTLEKLIPKLFQEGKQSILPTHIVVHIRTIQAWGNVGSHDQHADLFEEGLEVKQDEALAALNSLVAILGWYADKYLADGSTPSTPEPAARLPSSSRPSSAASAPAAPAPAPAPAAKSKTPIIAGLGAVALLGLGAAFALSGNGEKADDPEVPKPPATAEARAALTRAYLEAHEYPPPKSCETTDAAAVALFTRATKLLDGGRPGTKRPEDMEALKALSGAERSSSAEYWHLKARALHFTGADDGEVRRAADRAIELCKEFAPPYNLHGNLGLLADEIGFAKLSYQKAAELAPDYLSPVFNLGLIDLKAEKLDEAIAAFSNVLRRDPEYTIAYKTRAQAYLARGSLEEAVGDLKQLTKRRPDDAQAYALLGNVQAKLGEKDAARAAFCKAKDLGLEAAAKMCE